MPRQGPQLSAEVYRRLITQLGLVSINGSTGENPLVLVKRITWLKFCIESDGSICLKFNRMKVS